ncbi:MAG: redoxin domain-containing protein [Candidatus Dormibacteria bacterium]
MTELNVGEMAPDFTLRDSDNNEVTLSSYRGRNVVLMFYPLAFSPACTRELYDVTGAADRLEAQGADVLGVSVDSRWALKAWKEHNGYRARLLADFNPKGAVSQLYGAYREDLGFASRTSFVIDKDGRIQQKIETDLPQTPDPDQFLAALASCPV